MTRLCGIIEIQLLIGVSIYSHSTLKPPQCVGLFATILRQYLLAGLLGPRRRHFLSLWQKSSPPWGGFKVE